MCLDDYDFPLPAVGRERQWKIVRKKTHEGEVERQR